MSFWDSIIHGMQDIVFPGGHKQAKKMHHRATHKVSAHSHPRHVKMITNPVSQHGEVVGGYAGFKLQGGRRDPRVEPRPGHSGPNTADYLAQLAAQLQQGKLDYESALRQSANEIRKAYRIDIGSIRGNNRAARKETRQDSKQIGAMYNQLAASYLKNAHREGKQGNRDARDMSRIANQASKSLKHQTGSLIKNEDTLAKQLGAGGSPSTELTKQLVKGMGGIQKSGTSAATTSKQFSNNQRNFMRRGAQGARLEGADTKAGLTKQLEAYIRGNRDKISGLKSQRFRELASNRSNTLSEVSKVNEQAAQDTWSRAMDIAKYRQNNAQFRQSQRLDAAKLRASIGQNSKSSWDEKNNPMYPMMKFASRSRHPKRVGGFLQSTLPKDPQYASGQDKTGSMNANERANYAENLARSKGITNEKDIYQIRLAAYKGLQ